MLLPTSDRFCLITSFANQWPYQCSLDIQYACFHDGTFHKNFNPPNYMNESVNWNSGMVKHSLWVKYNGTLIVFYSIRELPMFHWGCCIIESELTENDGGLYTVYDRMFDLKYDIGHVKFDLISPWTLSDSFLIIRCLSIICLNILENGMKLTCKVPCSLPQKLDQGGYVCQVV